ncbi:hypothetical protein B0H13DRAFT_2679887 [Mycena leptocephala]|nr:hypothetical protein B0H13DRAFT_2679887 [Mycena leptocephala]
MATISDVLTTDSDSTGERVLGLDRYNIDFSMTRDCSEVLAEETIHRFSCKDPWKHAEMKAAHGKYNPRKITLPLYDTWIVGQIHETRAFVNYRIFDRSELRNCFVVTLKCPDSADVRSKEFFSKQIRALEHIMEHDGEDNSETSGWLGPYVNGAKTINVTLTEDAMGFWNSGWWAFLPDQCIKMMVRLRRDDGFKGKVHTYTAWLEEFAILDEEDLAE